MAQLALPLLIMSTVMTVAGGIQQAQSIQQATDYNAKMAKMKADMMKISGDSEVMKLSRAKRLMAGSQAMGFLASGVKLEGSPLLTMESTKAQYDLDIATSRYNTSAGIVSTLKDREQGIIEGGQRKTATKIKTIGSLLAGTYQIGSQMGAFTPPKQVTATALEP